jgi:uncharacterized protein YndB with AHSA1/START domain
MIEGTLVEIDGRPALRFTRRLNHPVERVWRAVTTHDDLAAWFVAPMEFTGAGQEFDAMEQHGEVRRFEPPHFLEWDWGEERFSFELSADGDGTLLTFVHLFADRERAANFASGWHFHFDRLRAHLDGEPVPEADADRLVELNDRYAEHLGIDADVGRRIIGEHFASR